ncbi:unnamed protein product, partial [Phaeothamnion confervicola]
PDPAPVEVVRRSPAFQKAVRGGRFDVSSAFVSPITRRLIAMSAQPIPGPDNATAGLIFLRIDLRELQDKIFPRPPAGTTVGLFDREGRYLMRWPDPDKWVGTQVNNLELMKRHASEKFSGVERLVGTDGVARIYAFHPVAGTDWIAASGVPESVVFAPYRARLMQGSVVGAFALLLAIGLALRISATIAKPVRDLQLTARRIAGGDVDARAPIDGPPELAAVEQDLNRMLDLRRAAEARFRGIVESAMDAIITIDEGHRIVQFNAAAEKMFGTPAAEALGSGLERLLPERSRAAHEVHIRTFGAGGATNRKMGSLGALLARRADGSEFPIEASISHTVSEGERMFTVILRDITARVEAEKQAKRQADFYAALSATNQAIVRMHEPQALYAEICRICVANGGATMAFVALVEDGHAVPKAWSGLIDGYLPGILIPLSYDTPEAQGPIATALRTGRPYICNDIYADPKTAPWRERASRIGSLGTAALPFRRGSEIVGVLSLHVQETGFFTPALVELLEEMATDLSFGLDNYDRERAQAEAMRQEHLASERFRKVFDVSPLATCLVRVADSRIVAVNPAYCTRFERTAGEILGRTALEIGIWADPADRQRMI